LNYWRDTLKFNEYTTKIYNIAFRLTGEENSAWSVASLAINKYLNNIKEDVDVEILNTTAKEVCKIFLLQEENIIKNKDTALDIQSSLLALDTLGRITIVWRDILGYNISDLAEISKHSKSELYKILNNARKQLILSKAFKCSQA